MGMGMEMEMAIQWAIEICQIVMDRHMERVEEVM